MEVWKPPLVDEVAKGRMKADALKEMTLSLEESKKKGYDLGYQQGFSEGKGTFEEKQKALDTLVANVQQAVRSFPVDIEQSVLTLVLSVAKAVVRHDILIKPERILEVIRSAIQELSKEAHDFEVWVHPEDKRLLEHSGIPMIEDTGLSRGSFIVKSAFSQIDATLESRLLQVTEALLSEKTA